MFRMTRWCPLFCDICCEDAGPNCDGNIARQTMEYYLNELKTDPRFFKSVVYTGGDPVGHPDLFHMLHTTVKYGLLFNVKTSADFMSNQKLADAFFYNLKQLNLPRPSNQYVNHEIHISLDKHHKNCVQNGAALFSRLYSDPEIAGRIGTSCLIDQGDFTYLDAFIDACITRGVLFFPDLNAPDIRFSANGLPFGIADGKVLKCGRALKNNIGHPLPPDHIFSFNQNGNIAVKFSEDGFAALETCGPCIKIPYEADGKLKSWGRLQQEFISAILTEQQKLK
jgi:hypothetical protein